MKIRGLIAGLLVALAIGGCTGSATEPDTSATVPAAFDELPPPPPDTTNRGGGALGSGA
jgi:hypothetical protein